MAKHYPVNDQELDALANKMLALDAEGQHQEYTQFDLDNAVTIFARVAGCLLYSQAMAANLPVRDAIKRAGNIGTGLRQFVLKHLNIDLHKTVKDLKALHEEHNPGG